MASTTGDRILLHGTDPFTFPADTPFHIKHGYRFEESVPRWGWWTQWDFKLFIDGVQRPYDWRIRIRERIGFPDLIRFWEWKRIYYLWWIFNFPNGLPKGKYVFRREYWVCCHVAKDWGTVNHCDDPNAIVLGHSNEKTGKFELTSIRPFV